MINVPNHRRNSKLLPHHGAELQASGLTPVTIDANGIYSEDDPSVIAKLLNRNIDRAKALGPVLVYPHFDVDGDTLHHSTLKPDKPRERNDKAGKVKYENPYQCPTRLYIPAGARDALKNPTAGLIITEGIKKALAATQNGFPTISVPGVWNWVVPRSKAGGRKRGPRRLNDDLAEISLRGRRVTIVFDSDAANKPDVSKAERALAHALRHAGADVRVARLPNEPDGAKNGLDDYLVRHGSDALRQLLEQTVSRSESANTEIDRSDTVSH